jgi:hypothetical protein
LCTGKASQHRFLPPSTASRTNPVSNRDQIKDNALLKKYYCDVDIGDLIKYNDELAHRMVSEPAEIIPLVSLP